MTYNKTDLTDRKPGWSPFLILALVFAPMGLLFLVLGVAFHWFGVGEDPRDPVIFLCVFGGIGLSFLAVGLGFAAAEHRRRAGIRRVLDGGEYVMARIVGVQRRGQVQVNGVHPYVAECHWHNKDTGEVHVYFSRYLYYDPTDLFTADEVPVYVDRMNDKVYYVDIDAVLPKVVLH